MTQEEKAKAYDEALERAKKWYNAPNVDKIPTFGNRVIEEIFPELKESEDERIRKALVEMVHDTTGDSLWIDYNVHKEDALAWLEKQGKSSDQIHYWTEEEIEPIISDYLRGAEHYGGMIARLRCLKPKSLEKQGENKKEINNFDVLPGLYKCVHRMFDGTPDGRLLFEVGNVYRCLSKHDRAEFEVSYGHSVYLEDPVVCKHFIPFEKQVEVVSDKDDIEAEEKGIRKAFNKIWEEKQDKQKSQRMISAEAKEAMYDKPANTVEPKCEESKTKIFGAPTPFEDKLYAFVLACEILADPSKREFILEHSQEILDAAKEQIGKEQSSTWSKEDEKEYKYVLKFVDNILNNCGNKKDYEHCKRCYDWLKSLKTKVHPKQEWSEKDEEELEIAIDTLKESGRYDSAKWVQSLKQRIGG